MRHTCNLADKPLKAISAVRKQFENSGLPADEILMEMANAVSDSEGHGEVVYYLNHRQSQLYLSACVRNGEWIIAPYHQFANLCGAREEL